MNHGAHKSCPPHVSRLMRATGGPLLGMGAGNMPSNIHHYMPGLKKGGPKRKHHADGRACHAEGDIVATPMKHGRSVKRHKHKHRAEGGEMSNPRPFNAMRRHPAYAEGGKTEENEKEMALSRGGHPHRKRHNEGDKVETMRGGGRKKKA